MDVRHLQSSTQLPYSYAPLPAGAAAAAAEVPPERRRTDTRLLSLAAAFFLLALVGFLSGDRHDAPSLDSSHVAFRPVSRGPSHGVSEKTSGAFPTLLPATDGDSAAAAQPYPWTNDMLQWQRTSFHFQPHENWMNDPNGPLWYNGWYHLFYQYNPDSAVWGNITWGHAVSRDLVHWEHLPLAMVPDRWYDLLGVWTGSATILPTGQIIMLYTGSTNESVQVQNLAVPADPADPLLMSWVKSDSNPVLTPPPGIGAKDFRDPTTFWHDPSSSDGTWKTAIGSKDGSHAGIVMVYETRDFVRYELLPGLLHRVPGTGMWECVDFFPVSVAEGPEASEGMDMSAAAAAGPGVRHVLKASLDDDRHDYYAVGTYDAATNTWRPGDEQLDVGIGLRYDWGKFYASKTFYDPAKRRRVLWGWIGECDSEHADVLKGWASVQAIPRTVLFDTKTGSNLLQWPVEEVEKLRTRSKNFSGITIEAGSVLPLNVTRATQLDIEAEFEIDEALTATLEADAAYNCSTSGGAEERGVLGPFGLLVLANERLSEKNAVYFYIARGADGNLRTHFCHDELRSSRANDIVKKVVGSTVPVLDGERLSVRILVDHSIIESFAQGGRTCITSRVYPTEAIYSAAKVFLFNNATSASVTASSLTIWEMDSTFSHPYATQA